MKLSQVCWYSAMMKHTRESRDMGWDTGWREPPPESEEQNGKAANKVQTKVTGWHKFKSHREREPKGEGQDVAERGER